MDHTTGLVCLIAFGLLQQVQLDLGDAEASDCPAANKPSSNNAGISAYDYIELKRTRCYGSCPDYTVRIKGDGTIEWHGRAYVKTTGNAVDHVDPSKAKELIKSAQNRNFWSLCGGYSRMVTDLPTYSTTLSIAGQTKAVSDYVQAAPKWVQDLEMEIDSVANTYHWIKGNPATRTFDRLDLYFPKPGVTPLMKAAGLQSLKDVAEILKSGADPNAEDSSGWTPVMYAAASSDMENLKLLLAAGGKVNYRSKMGETAVFAAISAPWTEPIAALKALKAAGADINAQDNQGNSPLMCATRYYRVPELIQELIRLGADKHLRNHAGLTAVDMLDRAWKGTEETASEEYRRSRALLAIH